jgi:hypothetical protein
VALWQGETHLVHVTVAASAGTAAAGADPASPLTTHILGPKDSLFTNLRDAVANVSDPGQRFLVDSYQPVYFNLKATVLVDPRRERAQVLAAVEQALIAAFAFERRGFGQPVTTAEIVTAIQGVAGVIACDLVHLYRYEEGKPPPGPAVELLPITGALPAAAVQRVGDRAELLLVNPVGITLEEMKS